MRILIIHSNSKTLSSLRRCLEQNLFTVDAASDCGKGLFSAAVNSFHLAVVEHCHPLNNAIEFCEGLRAKGRKHPVLVIVGEQDHPSGIQCLDAGADDFMRMPVFPTEFVARVRCLLRRPPHFVNETISVGDLRIDRRKQIVTRSRKEIHLTPKEYAILELLAIHKGAIVSKGELVDHTWGESSDSFFESALETHVYTLRQKLEKHGDRIIHNFIGRGYRLN